MPTIAIVNTSQHKKKPGRHNEVLVNFRDIQRAQGGIYETYWEELKRLTGM